jgi:leader peptidase (prepilin peptidase)/N-methyltransferase
MVAAVPALPGVDTTIRIVATCALAAAIEALLVWHFGWSAPLPAFLCFGAFAAVVTMTDLAARRLPNAVVGPGYVVGAALLALASAARGEWWPLERGGITLIVLGAFYFALGLAFPAGMGLGDIKWAGLVGLYLGWVKWEAASTATLVAFAGAALFIVVRRVATSEDVEHDTLPMAPFIAAGDLVAILAT